MPIKVAIVGDYSTGKSSSMLPIGDHKGLPPQETFIVSSLKKDLPSKGAMTLYSKENKNLAFPKDLEQAGVWIGGQLELKNDRGVVIKNAMPTINTTLPHIKYVVIDDFIYLSTKPLVDNITAMGYDKYNKMAADNIEFMRALDRLNDDTFVFCIFHEERIGDKENLRMKVKTASPFTDKLLNLEGLFTYVLYTDAGLDEKTGKFEYNFITNTTYNKSGILVTAKTPYGCFDTIRIPNDLGYVVDKINQYRK